MRRFSSDYLADTRRGLWTDREALGGLDLPGRRRILDVGCGTGALTDVLREESDAAVVGLDADPSLLRQVEAADRIVGDATRLPVADAAFDLVACQALLVNLPAPGDAVRAMAAASSDLVAAVEPDNGAVSVESSVDAEPALAGRARSAYLDGIDVDAGLGSDVDGLFEAVGLREVSSVRHELVRETAPPYGPRDVESARRKARATRLSDHERELRAGGLSAASYEALVADWRAMGRSVAAQLQSGDYRRTETVPFYVTVGCVPDGRGAD